MMNLDPMIYKDEIHLAIPAKNTHLYVVGTCITAFLERLEISPGNEMLIHNVVLAVHETCVNIIEHAYLDMKGRIMLVFTLFDNPDRFVIDIYDNGNRFTLPEIGQPNIGEIQNRGYGLFLTNCLMDLVIYDPGTNQNHWHFEKLIS